MAETLREPGPVTAAEALEGLASNGVSLFCSKRCFTLREFESGALRAGAVLAPPERLAALAAEGYAPLAM